MQILVIRRTETTDPRKKWHFKNILKRKLDSTLVAPRKKYKRKLNYKVSRGAHNVAKLNKQNHQKDRGSSREKKKKDRVHALIIKTEPREGGTPGAPTGTHPMPHQVTCGNYSSNSITAQHD